MDIHHRNCMRKRRYPSQQSADAFIATRLHDRRKTQRKHTRSYQCPVCGFWHLTSTKPKREFRSRRGGIGKARSGVEERLSVRAEQAGDVLGEWAVDACGLEDQPSVTTSAQRT